MKKKTLTEKVEHIAHCRIHTRDETCNFKKVLVCENMTGYQAGGIIDLMNRIEVKVMRFYWDVDEISENNFHLVIADYEKFED